MTCPTSIKSVHIPSTTWRDTAGNVGVATRTVNVTPDPDIPIITLIGDANLQHEASVDFTDPGVVVKDGSGEELDLSRLVPSGTVDPTKPGEYILTYNYEAPDNKTADEVIRVVTVSDTLAPELVLVG